MFTAVIVDDEPNSLSAIRKLINRYLPEIEILGEATSVEDAVEKAETLSPQLLFLDVELSDGSGFDVLNQFENPKFKVIFITAHEHYALTAIRYAALDYLLKPVHPQLLKEAVQRLTSAVDSIPVSASLETLKSNLQHDKPNKIILHTQSQFIIVEISNILFAEADGNYCKIHFNNGEVKIFTLQIGELESQLGNKDFYRVHKSYIVNIQQIKSIVKSEDFSIELNSGQKIPLAVRKRDDFMHFLKSNLM